MGDESQVIGRIWEFQGLINRLARYASYAISCPLYTLPLCCPKHLSLSALTGNPSCNSHQRPSSFVCPCMSISHFRTSAYLIQSCQRQCSIILVAIRSSAGGLCTARHRVEFDNSFQLHASTLKPFLRANSAPSRSFLAEALDDDHFRGGAVAYLQATALPAIPITSTRYLDCMHTNQLSSISEYSSRDQLSQYAGQIYTFRRPR